jgi:hypothetical protein
MHETQRPWDLPTQHWVDLFARNEAERAADFELSERLGREWAAELGLELSLQVAA